MATITPSVAFVRRLIPVIVLEAIALAVCIMGYVMTEHMGWFAGVGLAVLAFAAWTLYQLTQHRNEWRWWNGTPGTGR